MARERSEIFTGVYVPATTPFDPVTGDVAPVGLRENLRRWLDAGLDGIVLFGSTGEGVLLDDDEKIALIEYARGIVQPGAHLIAGAGADSTRATIRQIARLADAGADGVLVHPPVYFGSVLSDGALRDHYLAVADASPIPIVLYHMPKYTGITFDPGLVDELSHHENIPAMKDSSGDLQQLGRFVEACADRCRVLVGSGALLYPALEVGAAGGICAVGLLAPNECVRIAADFAAGDARSAGSLQERVGPAHRGIVGRYGVPGVKAALELLGLVGGPPRPPLQPLPDKARRDVARVLQDCALM